MDQQAMLDYVLGVNVNAFAEFQDKLVTPDPGHLYRLAAIRQAAIETCTKQLILPSEAVVGGWTLLSPTSSQDLKKLPQEGFEEKVLLLTDQALCVVSYEYSLEKIREYVRIPLDFIQEIRHGSLILSTLSSFARDPIENYGFILKYRLLQPGTTDRVEKRKNTYSLDTVKGQDELTEAFKEAAQDDLLHRGQLEQEIVFKHMRKDLGNYSVEEQSGHDGYTGEECIKSIVDTIVATAKRSSRGVATEIATKNQVLRSLEDAGASETFVLVCLWRHWRAHADADLLFFRRCCLQSPDTTQCGKVHLVVGSGLCRRHKVFDEGPKVQVVLWMIAAAVEYHRTLWPDF